MRLGFLVLIGLPGSGKTTLAKYLTEYFDGCSETPRHFIHVCYDDLISYSNGNREVEWKAARNSLTDKIERLVIAIKNKNIDFSPQEFKCQLVTVNRWEGDFILIIDDNMYFKSMRYSLFQVAKRHNIGYCQVFLNCSLNNALVINSIREPQFTLPSHVIENMDSKIEPPNQKNNWEKYSVELKAFCNLNEINSKILPVLNNSLNNYFYQKEETEMKELSKIECKKSLVHQIDIALRKIIGGKIKIYLKVNSNEESKNYISNLNLRKSEILSDVRVGNISLPDEILTEINSDVIDKFGLINFFDSYF